jgi:hypothetical protein
MALRRRVGLVRRGKFFPFVPTATPPAAVWSPGWLQRRRPASRRTGHGDFFPVVPAAQPPLPVVSRRLPARGPGRRGKLWALPPASTVAGLGPWLPRPMSRRRIPAQPRRGGFLIVPLAGLAPPGPPPFIPPLLTHRTIRVLPRRGEFLPVPAAPSYCATQVPRRRRPAAATRRGRQWATPPAVPLPPPGPGPRLPRTQRAAARSIPRRASRGRYWPMALESACDCTTHRPNLGATTRPSAGTTARPDSGTTSRPCSCND